MSSETSAARPFTVFFLLEARRLRHLRIACPASPQNKQSLLAMQCLHSSSLSFLSLPSLSAIVGAEFGGRCGGLEEEEFEEADCGFAAGDEEDDAEDLSEERKLGVWGVVIRQSWLISFCHSQYC